MLLHSDIIANFDRGIDFKSRVDENSCACISLLDFAAVPILSISWEPFLNQSRDVLLLEGLLINLSLVQAQHCWLSYNSKLSPNDI